ncbi:MAG: membrane-like protein [Candidatus Parvarchaeum acidiphilum ARMAN-4]|jgi:uncharacterized membrane protein (DUF4010 family)|uniref:Membrane-like protein n=1 Tax=Candidatus Parvarchaeum acidiphilum ARMAN-4 TaxID=662760 RepID=D2EEN8_PARA4|nr:MAG: membrane-like protein [Candidatus Parvarchaeum acidiphilum ARMAN-4]
MNLDLTFEYIVLSIALGAIFGLENEYRMQKGVRIFMGFRTSIFIALLGNLFALFYEVFNSSTIIIAGFAVMIAFSSAIYFEKSAKTKDPGATTYISSMILFLSGMLVGIGYYQYAIVIVILITAISFYKREFLYFINSIKKSEMIAAINLLIISFVILPLLPNTYMGPYNFFNPFQFWLLVALVGTVFFIQYMILRISKSGLLISTVIGSLITGTTITFALISLGNRFKKLGKAVVYNVIVAANIPMVLIQALLIIYIVTLSDKIVYYMLPITAVSVISLLAIYLIGKKEINKKAERPDNPFPLVKTLEFAAVFFLVLSISRIVAVVAPNLLIVDMFLSALANIVGAAFALGTLFLGHEISASYTAMLLGISVFAAIIEKGFIGLIAKDKSTRRGIFGYSMVVGLLLLITMFLQYHGI